MDIALLIFVLGVVIAGVVGYFNFTNASNTRQAVISEQIKQLQANCDDRCEFNINLKSQVDAIAATSKVFWEVLSPHFAKIIHSPDHQDRDELMDKYVSGEITHEEAVKLSILLDHAVNNSPEDNKRFVFAMILARVKSLLATGGL